MAARVVAVPPLELPERSFGVRWSDPARVVGARAELLPWQPNDVLAVTVRPQDGAVVADATAHLVAEQHGLDLAALIQAEQIKGRTGEVTRVPVPPAGDLPRRWFLVGVGQATPTDLRRAGAALARATRSRARLVTSLLDGADDAAVRAGVEGLILGGYSVPAWGTRARNDKTTGELVLLSSRPRRAAAETAIVHARATVSARDLAALPADPKTPDWLARQARTRGEAAGLDVTLWDEEALAAEGFGGLLAVGRGSANPPRLVRLDHTPAGRSNRGRIVLVGKGVTFDTGGLSIKPRDGMVPMKTDMSGAAVVLAAITACAALGVRRPVTALLPLAENAVGAESFRPSDVIRHYGGRTVEVINTDAEGRLVLADALAYAVAELDPALLVDVATLTGAATLGLGRRHAPLYGTDERLLSGLEAAATASGEQVWRMPLVEDYRPSLDSEVADLRNVAGGAWVGAGSVVAALFLREFTGGRPWAHLDIAGTGRSEREEYEVTKGPTGFGARLLLRWLESLR